MHRNRTWTLDPPEWRTQRNRLLPIEGGDGSTLNLDFTKGVLDSGITFSRLGTATFVNSSGYVEWAASNEMTYSQAQDNNSFWNAYGTNVVRTSAQTDPDGGTNAVKLVFTATAADAVISRTVAINNGLPYTISMWMRADSGTVTNVRFGRGATAAGAFFPTLTTTWQRVSLSFTASGSTDGIEIRVLNSGSPQTATFHVYGAQLESGSTVRTYQPALATAAYYAPRFDYNPTTIGLSRGLLIETSAVNYVTFSGTLTNVIWQVGTGGANDVTLSANTTETLDPFGLNTAAKVTKPNTSVGYGFVRQTSLSTGTSAGVRTVSIWVKQPTTGAARYVGLRASGDGFTPATPSQHATFDLQTGTVVANVGTAYYTNVSITPYRNGWYRISATSGSMAGTTANANASLSIVRSSDGEEFNTEVGSVYIWGPQLELGSGTSSYIPTGASVGNRVEDSLTIPDGSWLNKSEINSTWLFEGSLDKTVSNFGSLLSYITTGDYLGQNRIFIATDTTQTRFYHYARSAAGVNFEVPISDAYPNAYNFNTSFRIAATFNNAANKNIASLNSAPSFGTVTTASLTTPTYTTISIGSNNNWHIQKIKYYPVSLSQSELNVITSPNYVAPSFSVDFVPMSSEADLLAKGLTFRRLSTATFINTAGFVDFAGANLLLSSNNVSTTWGRTALITPFAPVGIPAPNGSTTDITAVIPDATNTQDHRIFQSVGVLAGFTYTISFYVKPYGYNFFRLFDNSANSYLMNFNLSTNTVVSTTGISNLVIGIPDAAGWRKISFSFVQSISSSTNTTLFTSRPDANFTAFVGDTTSGALVWGFQLNPGSTAQTYYPTTTTTYHAPRFDNKVLTSRTNLILQSNNFAPTTWAQKDGTHLATVTAAYEAAPPGFTGTATRITSSNAAAGITQALSVPTVSGKPIRISFYAKSNTVTTQNCMLQYNSSTSAVITIPTTWTRIDEVAVSSVTEITLKGFIELLDISIYGMQVEYVTSGGATAYIPTTTTTTTVNTTEPIGLLNEGVSTNSLLYSQNFTIAPWTIQALGSGSYTTVSPTGGMAPDNTNTAIRFIEGTGFFSRSIYQNIALSANVYTASVFVKAGYGDLRYIRLVLASAAGNYVHATVNITTGAVTQGPAVAGTGVSTPKVTVTPYAGSWYRISVTATFAATTNFFFIVPSNVATPAQNTGDYNRLDYVGTGASFLLWGAQVELGEGPTSYIPTGTTTVQRTPDLLAITSATAMGLNVLEGTFFTETELPRGGLGQPALFGAPYGNNSWLGQLYNTSDATTLSTNWWGAGVAAISRGSATKTVSAVSYGLYTGMSLPISSSLNGVVATAMIISSGGNHAPNPSAWSFISLASNLTALSSTSRDNLHACIKRFSYYPTRLTNAQLIALTA